MKSVFQSGFRATQRFLQLLIGFPETGLNYTILNVKVKRNEIMNVKEVRRLKKVEKPIFLGKCVRGKTTANDETAKISLKLNQEPFL